MRWKIRKAEIKDIPQLMSLFSSQISKQKSEYFFHWWNEIPSTSITFCAMREEELIGMFVVLKRKLINNLNCGVLMGLLVKTEWRGSGLFKELGEAAMNYFEDVDLFCCLTNSIGKKSLEKNFGFRTVDNIDTMCLSNDTLIETETPDLACIPITSNTKFYSTKIKKYDTVMFLADDEFRRWRFAIHPFKTYCIMQTESGEFVVVNTYHDKSKDVIYGDIADFEIQPVDELHFVDVLKRVYLSLKKNVDIVTIQAVPHSLLHEAAEKIGFTGNDAKHFLCLKIREPKNEYLYNSSDWIIKWGDYLR